MSHPFKSLLVATTLVFSGSPSASPLPQFQGEWHGVCTRERHDGSRIDGITLDLAILPVSDDTLSWSMTYQGDEIGTIVKNYALRAADVANNHYVLDENNGVLLDHYLFGNRLIADFDVANSSRNSVSTEVLGDKLYFENIAFEFDVERRTHAGSTMVVGYQAKSIESCALER